MTSECKCSSFQNYTDYFKCIAAKGEDFAPCKQFKRAYNSLCPSACLHLLRNILILTVTRLDALWRADEWVSVSGHVRFNVH